MSAILFLSRWFPDPPTNGSKLRIYNLLCSLAKHHDVTLLSFHAPTENPDAATVLPQLCTTIRTVPWQSFNPRSRRARLAFLSPYPRFVVDTFSAPLQQALDALLATQRFDAVIASQIDMAAYSPAFRHIPSLFEEAETTTLYEQYAQAPTSTARLRNGLTWFKHRRYLRQLLHNFDAVTVVSEAEKELLLRAAPSFKAVSVIANGVDFANYQGVNSAKQPKQLIFTGALTYDANYEAVNWFLKHVYPYILEDVPDVQLLITGDSGERPLPPAASVTLTGFVDDIRPLVTASAVSIAPILTGGGTRLKILEAMAAGTPVVATHKGAEGLSVISGQHILLADEPQAFARAVVQLVQDRPKALELAGRAQELVRTCYDWSAILPDFLNLVEMIMTRRRDLAGTKS